MMTKAQSVQNKNVAKLMKKLNLSEPEYELAMDYLDGRAEECELGKLHHQNLSRLDWKVCDIAVSLFTEFMADHGHMIDLIMPDSALYEETLRTCVRSYLRGDDRISVLYPYAGQVCFDTDVHRGIERYQKHCDDKVFLDRWKSCVALCGAQDIVPGNSVEEVEALFRSFEHEGMDVAGLDMGVEMHFSGRPIEQGNETVRLQEARFYRVGAIERRRQCA